MIITRTPFRMSFFGGGTDFKEYYEEYGGTVLSSTFDKYCFINVRHLPNFFEYRTHLTYSKTEYVSAFDEIHHPLIREAMRYLDIHDIRLIYDADLPARTGIGTSSAFAVGLLNAFYALKGKRIDKKRLSEEAIYIERELCLEYGGIQDQIAAAYGGMNRIDMNETGWSVSPLVISSQRLIELNSRLMLFFTGFTRTSSDVQKNVTKKIKDNVSYLNEMKSMVDEAVKVLESNKSMAEFGKLLHHTWMLKRRLSENISNAHIDSVYEVALKAGATGGKILGAGNGGFMLFYVDEDRQDDVKKALKELMHVPFAFESDGTQVIYYDTEEYVPRLAMLS